MRVRVLSLNVWDLPAPFGHRTRERIQLISARLPSLDCDVLVFQEVWTAASRAELLAGGRRAGHRYVWHREAAAGGSGLLVLSRAPIRSSHFVPYALSGLPQRVFHADFYGGKGFVRLSIDFDGETLVLFGTHLHARYLRDDQGDEYLGHRAAEIVEIAAAIRAESAPIVAIGDFNLREDSSEYAILLGLTGLVDAGVALDSRQPTVTLSNSYRRARGASNEHRIDYVFCRSGEERGVHPSLIRRVLDESVEIAGEPGNHSDHAGLLAEVELGGPGATRPKPEPEAIGLARELLESGRHQAKNRQTGQRLAAGSSLLAGASALAASRAAGVSRRRLLKAGLLMLGGTAWVGCASLAALSEVFVPDELAGYARVSALLDGLAARQHTRLSDRHGLHSLRWSDGLPGGHLRSRRGRARLAAARHSPL